MLTWQVFYHQAISQPLMCISYMWNVLDPGSGVVGVGFWDRSWKLSSWLAYQVGLGASEQPQCLGVAVL